MGARANDSRPLEQARRRAVDGYKAARLWALDFAERCQHRLALAYLPTKASAGGRDGSASRPLPLHDEWNERAVLSLSSRGLCCATKRKIFPMDPHDVPTWRRHGK